MLQRVKVGGKVVIVVAPPSTSSFNNSLTCTLNDVILLFRRHHHHYLKRRQQTREEEKETRNRNQQDDCWTCCPMPGRRTSCSSVTTSSSSLLLFPSSASPFSTTPCCGLSPSGTRISVNSCPGNESEEDQAHDGDVIRMSALGTETTNPLTVSCPPRFLTLCSRLSSNPSRGATMMLVGRTKEQRVTCLTQSPTLLTRLSRILHCGETTTTSTRSYSSSTSSKEPHGAIVGEGNPASGEGEEIGMEGKKLESDLVKGCSKDGMEGKLKKKRASSDKKSMSSSSSDSSDSDDDEKKVIGDQKNKRTGHNDDVVTRKKKQDDQMEGLQRIQGTTSRTTAGDNNRKKNEGEGSSSDDEEGMNDEILAYLRHPKKVRFGVLKVILTIVAGIYAGAFLAKFGANLLEEYEIFVKEDDDDD